MAAASNDAVFNTQTSTLTIDPSALDSSTLHSSVSEPLTTNLSTNDLSSVGGSIINFNIAEFSPSPGTSNGSRVKWRTSDYDDGVLLLNLRLAQRNILWAETAKLFNSNVPFERRRTVDAVTNKGQQLMRVYTSRTAPAAPRDFGGNDFRWGHSPAPPQDYSDFGWEETLLPYNSWDFPARHMEVLSNSWDGLMDTEGYSKAIMEEMEALEIMDAWRKRALEAASGIRTR